MRKTCGKNAYIPCGLSGKVSTDSQTVQFQKQHMRIITTLSTFLFTSFHKRNTQPESLKPPLMNAFFSTFSTYPIINTTERII